MRLASAIDLNIGWHCAAGIHAGGPGSGCRGENCGRPRLSTQEKVSRIKRPIPIKVKTIDEAIKLIGKGKTVELPGTKEVHTLLAKLAQMASEAKAAGTKAKNYDLCKVTVANTNLFCAEHLGVPRIKMPQFGGEARPGSEADKLPKNKEGGVDGSQQFLAHLEKIGIKSEEVEVQASHLRASQRQLVGAKVAGIAMSGKDLNFGNPIFISRDNYVIDGHHRWAALVGRDAEDAKFGNMPMKVVKVDAPISEVLHLANKWTKEFGIDPKGA